MVKQKPGTLLVTLSQSPGSYFPDLATQAHARRDSAVRSVAEAAQARVERQEGQAVQLFQKLETKHEAAAAEKVCFWQLGTASNRNSIWGLRNV